MKPSINLSTRTYFNKRALRSGFLSAATALTLWVLLGGYFLVRDVSYLSSLQDKISVLEEKRFDLRSADGTPISSAEIKKRGQEVAFINRLLERDSFRWTELLDDLERQAFNGIVISSISPDFKDNTLAVNGFARELRHLRGFIDNLMEDTSFKEVYLLKQNIEKVKTSTGQEKEAIAFVISLVQEQ